MTVEQLKRYSLPLGRPIPRSFSEVETQALVQKLYPKLYRNVRQDIKIELFTASVTK